MSAGAALREQPGFYDMAGAPPKKLGVLGGTFDPCHRGHTFMAQAALDEFSLDRVLLIPVGDPPHKHNIGADAEHRFAMCELAAKGHPGLMASRLEIDRAGTTYTVDTLKALTQSLKETEIHFIIGSDTLFEIITWKDYKSVIKMCRFICIVRPGEERDVAGAMGNLHRLGAEMSLSHVIPPDISSTNIRALVRSGRSISGYVSPQVEEYIYKNGVYR